MGGCLALACFLVGLPFLVLFWPATLICWLFGVLFLLAGGRSVARREHEAVLEELARLRQAREGPAQPPTPPAVQAPPIGSEAFAKLCRLAGEGMNHAARWAWSPPVRPTFLIAAAMLAVAAVLALVMRA